MHVIQNYLMLSILFMGAVACDDTNNKQAIDQAVNEIKKEAQILDTASIRNSIDLISDEIVSNTNGIPLILQDDVVTDGVEIDSLLTTTEPIITEPSINEYIAQDTVKQPAITKSTRPKSRSKLKTISYGSYIKIGIDRPKITVSRTSSQKITVVVIGDSSIKLTDVYIYAIPIGSRLVRNHNTLIGFVNNLEVVNNQAQFTRFWNGKRSNGSFMKPGHYNIYVEYRYKNAQGVIIKKQGRYWGGSKRRWTIEIL
ncbi:MAG: hypothetical protein ACRCVW_03525 [Brevinema sp.]